MFRANNPSWRVCHAARDNSTTTRYRKEYVCRKIFLPREKYFTNARDTYYMYRERGTERERKRETHLRNIIVAFPPPCLSGMEIICAAVSSRGGPPEASPPSRQDVVGEIVPAFFFFASSPFFSEALKVLKWNLHAERGVVLLSTWTKKITVAGGLTARAHIHTRIYIYPYIHYTRTPTYIVYFLYYDSR